MVHCTCGRIYCLASEGPGSVNTNQLNHCTVGTERYNFQDATSSYHDTIYMRPREFHILASDLD